MKPLLALVPALILVGCTEKDRNGAANTAAVQGRKIAAQTKTMAESLWLSAQREAGKITADSSQAAIESARGKLIDLQSQMADLKAPTEVQSLQMSSIETEISRLEAATEMKDLKAKMEDLHAGDRLQDLKDKYAEAKQNYDSAMETMIEFREQLKTHGVPLPQ
ncbi:hypothetical protein BH11ARM2_BH11ARM2_09430 [soil metagenome]